MGTITINIDDDNRPLIENANLFEDSLMKMQYKQGFEAIESVLRAQKSFTEDSIYNNNDVEYPNNIIVFDGERGSGKTSCMLSIAQMLCEDSTLPYQDLGNLSQTVFSKLSMIEPVFFDNEHNVLNLIISRLYTSFSKLKNVDPERKRSVLRLFAEVRNNLKCMFEKLEEQDALEYFVNLSAAVGLKQKLRNIIREYLDAQDGSAQKLLILIDDLDLDEEHAYEMVEEIRKYLILDNCIILVSLKIKQLSGILERTFEKGYHNHQANNNIQFEIKDRVDRYLSKLFPQRHRVFMPLPDDYLKSELIIKPTSSLDYRLQPGTTVEQAVPDLIFAKTRYLFYNTRKKASSIVPRNLRSIRQILKLLLEMPNYIEGDQRSTVNKEVFKHYFFNEWIEQNIHSKDKQFVEELIIRDNLSTVNYEVVQYLSSLIAINITISNYKEISAIIGKQNHYYNISLGDVFSMIRLVESLKFDSTIQNLLFFIKSFYSIRLYEAYDSITPEITPLDDFREKYYICRNENGLVKDDYQAVVAGSVFNSSIEDFHLHPQIANLKFYLVGFTRILEEIEKEQENKRKEQLFRLIEFLMLFISYQESSKTDVNYRQKTETFYNSFGNDSNQPFVGSFGAFIYNLYCYKEAIERFKPYEQLSPFFEFFNNADSDTLYSRLKKYADQNRKENALKKEDAKLLSVCCFRNMEVLEDFYETISSKIYSNTIAISSLVKLFENASSYSINTYDRHIEDGNAIPYTINFGFLSLYSDLLKDPFIQLKLDAIFKDVEALYHETRDNETIELENLFDSDIPSSES